ncbi:MAG: TIM barrel protein [Candidatus Promineifilaceae bacterium]|nr:TIM barrel protein [Candidatus Promineifilaceae bacterium]
MEYTGYLDFWFTDLPIEKRIAKFVALGIRNLNFFFWRQAPVSQLASECEQHGATLYSTFDDNMGSLADPGDNEKTLRSWAQSLEMAERFGITALYVFSNQIVPQGDVEFVQRLSGNFSEAEQYANLLDQTEQIMKLVEQTRIEVRVECLNQFHFIGKILVDNPQLAADWVRRISHPQFRLTFDTYHQQRGSGELLWNLETHFDLISAVHIGDVPTRQEPGTGEINFVNIRKKLQQLQYDGEIGLEFSPSTTETAAIKRVREIFPLTYDEINNE